MNIDKWRNLFLSSDSVKAKLKAVKDAMQEILLEAEGFEGIGDWSEADAEWQEFSDGLELEGGYEFEPWGFRQIFAQVIKATRGIPEGRRLYNQLGWNFDAYTFESDDFGTFYAELDLELKMS